MWILILAESSFLFTTKRLKTAINFYSAIFLVDMPADLRFQFTSCLLTIRIVKCLSASQARHNIVAKTVFDFVNDSLKTKQSSGRSDLSEFM